MDNDNDFTFCQVGSHVDQDGTEAQKLLPDIGGIVIKEELTNDGAGSQSNGFVRKIELLSNGASKKEATFGSLSFSVIDASPSKQSSAISGQALSENAGNEVKVPQEPRAAARKLAPRVKVPFEKGYSPMDWMKLTRTHPDLAGLKGQSNRRLISMSEVKEHRTEGSMWTVLKGRVYNLSPYMKFHPGGSSFAVASPHMATQPEADCLQHMWRHWPRQHRLTPRQLILLFTFKDIFAFITPPACFCSGFNTSHVATFPESEPTLSDAEATPSDTKATGYDILMKAVGKDCTSLFNKYHAWVNAEFLLEKCLVGTLDDSQ